MTTPCRQCDYFIYDLDDYGRQKASLNSLTSYFRSYVVMMTTSSRQDDYISLLFDY